MPRKVRDVERDLSKAGFILDTRGGKGSHRKYKHPLVPEETITVSGNSGDDVRAYLEKQVRDTIRIARQREQEQKNG